MDGPHPEQRRLPPSNDPWADEWVWSWGYPADRTVPHGHLSFTFRYAGDPVAVEFRTWAWWPGHGVVGVVDDAVPPPRRPNSLEFRADGLWADHDVMEPLVRATADLEAYGVLIDSLDDLHANARGERVGFGYELDWDADPTAPPITTPDGYRVVGSVEGVVLLGDERFDLRTTGWRSRRWG